MSIQKKAIQFIPHISSSTLQHDVGWYSHMTKNGTRMLIHGLVKKVNLYMSFISLS